MGYFKLIPLVLLMLAIAYTLIKYIKRGEAASIITTTSMGILATVICTLVVSPYISDDNIITATDKPNNTTTTLDEKNAKIPKKPPNNSQKITTIFNGKVSKNNERKIKALALEHAAKINQFNLEKDIIIIELLSLHKRNQAPDTLVPFGSSKYIASLKFELIDNVNNKQKYLKTVTSESDILFEDMVNTNTDESMIEQAITRALEIFLTDEKLIRAI